MNGEMLFRDFMADKKIVAHTERVVEMCITFADELNLPETDKEVMINSAWLHDIAKLTSGKTHNLPENIKTVLKDTAVMSEDVLHIIYNHKDEFSPKVDLALICAILRICDKLDKFNKNAGDAADRCESSMLLIQQQLPSDVYKKFETIYNAVKLRILQNRVISD